MSNKGLYDELENCDLLVARVDKLRKAGFRLAQACVVTKEETFDVLYSFVKADFLFNLRVRVAEGEELESITSIYPYAFLYENEMRDLFGLPIRNIAVDFKGELYQTKNPTPFVMADDGKAAGGGKKETTA